MAQWRYILKISSDLRDAIAEKNYEDLLEYLGKAWSEIYYKFPNEFDWDDLRNNMSPIMIEKDNLLNYKDSDITEEERGKRVNILVKNLTDYCNMMGILVDI